MKNKTFKALWPELCQAFEDKQRIRREAMAEMSALRGGSGATTGSAGAPVGSTGAGTAELVARIYGESLGVFPVLFALAFLIAIVAGAC